ncbi:MAG: DNA polymerase IV [Alphaproteobacteria bacterium]|nr:DNA polymerase IV [Alphaproteobacteria bacterium]
MSAASAAAPGPTALCRDCDAALAAAAARCPSCGSPRVVAHPELGTLAIAHIDCDAFYASIEKRDDPALASKPVIVGGGRRGVVSAACYVARQYGVRSAMPMFKALAACPGAVVLKPDMAKYAREGRRIRLLMEATTPLVEPVSIDEAYLDLTGTQALHGGPPALTLARLARRIEAEVGVTVSIGLAPNKFLAKVASDLDKPRGFAVLGAAEAKAFLAPRPVGFLHGVGPASAKRLSAAGIRTCADLQAADPAALARIVGSFGFTLHERAFGRDDRAVDPGDGAKSVSAETTFDVDISDRDEMAAQLWPLCERVARRMKRARLAGSVATLKLKGTDFAILTRSRTLDSPTQLAQALYDATVPLLDAVLADGPRRRWRLVGVGLSGLAGEAERAAERAADLFAGSTGPGAARTEKVERAIDAVREKLGDQAIFKGRSLRARRAH